MYTREPQAHLHIHIPMYQRWVRTSTARQASTETKKTSDESQLLTCGMYENTLLIRVNP